MYSEIQDIVRAGATVTEDMNAGVAIVTWYSILSLGEQFPYIVD